MPENLKAFIVFFLGIVCLFCIWLYNANKAILFISEFIIFVLFFIAFKSYKKVRKELQFLREFHHLSQALDDIRQIDSNKPFQNILRAVLKICGLDRAAYLKIDNNQERLVLAAVEGFESDILHDLDICCKNKCSLWELIQYKEPIVLKKLNNKTECKLLNKYFKDCTALFIPITRNNIKWGCIIADRISCQLPITDDDLLQIQILSDQIAITLQNHYLQQELLLKAQILEEQFIKFKKELEIAKIVQEGVLSKKIPNLKNIRLEIFIKPARIISGDFIRFINVCKLGKQICIDKNCDECQSNVAGIIIGDVCGKGIPAALVMAVVNSLFGEKITKLSDPAIIMKEVNLSLKEYLGAESRFNTSVFLGLYDKESRKFVYCNAGHEFPIFYSTKNKKIKLLQSTGTLLGLFKESEYHNEFINLEPNDKILFYTDGLLDFIEKFLLANNKKLEKNIDTKQVHEENIHFPNTTNPSYSLVDFIKCFNEYKIEEEQFEIDANPELVETLDESHKILFKLITSNSDKTITTFLNFLEQQLSVNQNLQEDDVTLAILTIIS